MIRIAVGRREHRYAQAFLIGLTEADASQISQDSPLPIEFRDDAGREHTLLITPERLDAVRRGAKRAILTNHDGQVPVVLVYGTRARDAARLLEQHLVAGLDMKPGPQRNALLRDLRRLGREHDRQRP
jgi:hypothetical protein